MPSPDIQPPLLACESLSQEHRETEKLLQELEFNLSEITTQNFLKIRKIFNTLQHDLKVHFTCEEQGLFPILNPYHPMVLMEVEHEELLTLQNEVENALLEFEKDPSSSERVRTNLQKWSKELQDHIGREDYGIFPTAERALSLDEKKRVIEKMEQIRQEDKTSPLLSISRVEPSFEKVTFSLTPTSKSIHTLLEKENLLIKRFSMKANEEISENWSPHAIYLLCLQGEGIWRGKGEEHPLKIGESIWMDERLPYGLRAIQDSVFLMLYLKKYTH